MGLIIKNYKNTEGYISDRYIKISSIRAGMGENNKISCCCDEWYNNTAREENKKYVVANKYYHIPDSNIQSSDNLINAVYPLFKEYLINLGYEVEDDTNNYSEIIKSNTTTVTATNTVNNEINSDKVERL